MKLELSSPADQHPSSEVLESADLLREILVKLPPKTVFGFTLVSSHWNKTITDPELTCLLKVPRNPSAVFVRRLVLQEDHDVVKYTHIPLEGVTRGGRPLADRIIAVYLPTYRGDRLKLLVLEPNQNPLQWRNTGVEFPVTGAEVVNYWYGVDVDGVIYWPCYKSSGLMFFDVREETVHWLPEVPHPYDKFSGLAYFGECKGNLCMVADVSMRRGTFDMLELKTDRSMWFIKYHIDLTGRVSRDENLQILVLALLPGEEEEAIHI
ncbi:hypothetical protein ACET3Z_030986 [Daucus carota]